MIDSGEGSGFSSLGGVRGGGQTSAPAPAPSASPTPAPKVTPEPDEYDVASTAFFIVNLVHDSKVGSRSQWYRLYCYTDLRVGESVYFPAADGFLVSGPYHIESITALGDRKVVVASSLGSNSIPYALIAEHAPEARWALLDPKTGKEV